MRLVTNIRSKASFRSSGIMSAELDSEQSLEAFRRDARAWLEANCPAEMRQPLVDEYELCWGGRRFEFKSWRGTSRLFRAAEG
jgi:hypothetical protein